MLGAVPVATLMAPTVLPEHAVVVWFVMMRESTPVSFYPSMGMPTSSANLGFSAQPGKSWTDAHRATEVIEGCRAAWFWTETQLSRQTFTDLYRSLEKVIDLGFTRISVDQCW